MMELCNITKTYAEKVIFDNFDLRLEDGERLMLCAPSGRGKTTLLGLMMGLIKPDGGTVQGIPQTMAAVFQEDRLPDDFTPLACIRMTAPRTVSKETITAHLNEAGLADCLQLPVKNLSGGQKRRVAIVRAVISDAEMLFLDEPFTGLDPETKKKMCAYINKYTKGKTLVAVSHDEHDAELLECKSLRI